MTDTTTFVTDSPPVFSGPLDAHQIAKQLLDEHGNIALAAQALEALALADDDLYRQITSNALRTCCADLVKRAAQSARNATIQAANAPAPLDFARLGLVVQTSLMDFPIWGGKRLGDCNRADLTQAGQSYMTHAVDMACKGKWLINISDRLPDTTTTVRQALDDDTLQALRLEAQAAVVVR